MKNEIDLNNVDESEIIDYSHGETERMYKTARRRSISGSSIINNIGNQYCKSIIDKTKKNDNHKKYQNSELETTKNNMNVLDSSSKTNVSELNQQEQHPVSTRLKIKQFLEEHIVKSHPCYHPEHHLQKKDSDINISDYNLKNDNLNEPNIQEWSSHLSSDSSSIKEVLTPQPASSSEFTLISDSLAFASSILDRIRLINIQSFNPSSKTDSEQFIERELSSIKKDDSNSYVILEKKNTFPHPAPNPSKLPQVLSPSSIDFSPIQLLDIKPKSLRFTHSISYDPEYEFDDIEKNPNTKRLNQAMYLYPEFIPEKDKWEKKISGYLDTSTPTGAALTAINFGLKKVTETDKYLMITKSPTLCPNEFLEEGISRVEATSTIYQSLMRHSTCYDAMPHSGKVVIVDSQMQIGHAFDAIESHIVRAAPIWSSEKQGFIALLTVNDLVHLLLHLHLEQMGQDHSCENESLFDDFSKITVEKCLDILPRFHTLHKKHIVGLTPETNLRAVNVIFNKFYRTVLLIIDSFLSGNPLFLLSDLQTLTYIFYKAHNIGLESCFLTSIFSSNLLLEQHFETLKPLSNNTPSGKFQYLIFMSSSIVDVLQTMVKSYYCCALIVEEKSFDKDCSSNEYIIKNVITMADIMNLVKIQKHRDRTITAAHIIQFRNDYKEQMTYRDPVLDCSVNDSIQSLISIIVRKSASFVLVHTTNDKRSPTLGILTAHDVLNYIDSLPYKTIRNHNSASFQLNKLEKCHKTHSKYSEKKLRSNSDNLYTIRHKPTLLDASMEEIFDFELS